MVINFDVNAYAIMESMIINLLDDETIKSVKFNEGLTYMCSKV